AAAGRRGMADPREGTLGSLDVFDPDGYFYYDGLPPGEYELTVMSPGLVFSTQAVTLGSGEEREIEILLPRGGAVDVTVLEAGTSRPISNAFEIGRLRSEEHTSELQSRENLVCRLLLEKKKKKKKLRIRA